MRKIFTGPKNINTRVAFSLAIGLVSGNDYSSAFKDNFSGDVSGFLGWINLELALDVSAFNYSRIK
jgi:hypothetical protein